jgi:phosphate acetyltransferase
MSSPSVEDRPFQFDPSNSFLAPLVEMLARHPKRVVFAEGDDPRVLRVASELARLECVSPILVGQRRAIERTAAQLGISMEFIGIVQPEDSSDFQAYCERYRRSERLRRRIIRSPEEIMALPQYFAAMMVQYGAADAVVGGNKMIPAAFFRGLFHLIKRQEHLDSATSCMAVRLPHRPDLGNQGVLFLADCAVIPTPTVGQLADIAVETAKVAGPLLHDRARVAMLSFSTKGSARNLTTDRMQAATQMARLRARQQQVIMDVDGEMQLDAAIVPAAADRKSPQSLVAGKANVLIFPDLNASHIAFKMLQHVAGAECYGQIVLGLARPAVHVSRVTDELTLFGAAICAAYQSISYRESIEDELWEM